ncbi:MAG TPA: site-specific integrase, partial [Mycobacterium sp.]|nr:site-specific integrase [Mycobacterium sp.]
MLRYLRESGVAPASTPIWQGPGEAILVDFATYLRMERGLNPRTIEYYLNLSRPFVDAFWSNDNALTRLCARDVAGYVAARLPAMRNGRAKLTVTALRSFLRFAHATGLVPERLDPLVPAVAG